MAQAKFHHITPDGGLKRYDSLDGCLKAGAAGGYVWLDYVDPSRQDLEPLVGALGIDPLSVEDCLDEDQVPKVENFDASTFILFNSYSYAGGKLLVDEVDLILGRGFLVTVRGRENRTGWSQEVLDSMMLSEPKNIKLGPEFLLHLLLDYVVDEKYKPIGALEAEIEAIEASLLKDTARFKLSRLTRLRNDLLALRKSLFHEREILVKICRRDSPFIGDKSIFHFRDIYDHLTKFFEEVEIYREILVSLAEIYLSLINNRMAHVSNVTNRSVRRLTVITTIFMPLSFLAGVGGMSEWTMMTGQQHWKLAYPAFLLAMVAVGVGTYLFLRRLEHDAEPDGG